MLLREYLTEYTKEELLDQARSFEIRKCSGLRKADLIDRIVDNFCTEEMLRSRLACLTKEQMDLFRKACISPTAVSVNEVVDAMQLYRYWIGYFEEPTDRFCVFEDVAVAFSKVDDESFQLEAMQKRLDGKVHTFFYTILWNSTDRSYL
ncbi:MAG: Rho termination factor N-terminal domain-containing protein [Coprococcus phoceensis]